MMRDAELPDGIRPSRKMVRTGNAVLVTGATGFLGRHLVSQLLERTHLGIVCLVRATDESSARNRLLASLAIVQPAMTRLPGRISVVVGDVSQDRLGLPNGRFEELAAGIGEIIHCAAEVNWQRSYTQLRNTNVNGCQEIIRLACLGPLKRIQFVSTLGVCFTGNGSGCVDESTETLAHIGTMPLGYAQSKCVAENLFRQAAQRSVPVSIVRPGLISGNSVTGASDHDDVLSAMFEGCINAHAAPDLDWLVDCVSVDFVATVLARLTGTERPPWDVLHLIHDRGRHWREIALWMNLYGHDVSLMPVEDWNRIVFKHGATSARLRRFRRFFSGSWHQESGSAPYETYLAPGQRRIDSLRSQTTLNSLGMRPPPLDATLLARYLEHFASSSLVPRVRPPVSTRTVAQASILLERTMRPWLAARGSEIITASERPFHDSNGILNELSSVHDGGKAGIKLFDVVVRDGNGAVRRPLTVLLKSRVRDTQLQDLTADVATLCDPELGRWFKIFKTDLGLTGCHKREIALYRLVEPRLRRHSPACFGVFSDSRNGLWSLALEFVGALDATGCEKRLVNWDAPQIEVAIEGLGEIHSIWYGKEAELIRQPWLTNVVDAERQIAMTPLWSALARFAAPRFSKWLGGTTKGTQAALIRTIGGRARRLETLPRTLIHNDFNPRNLLLRETAGNRILCAFDWELATIGVPQHDLAEFLCFALPESAGREDVAGWLELHRTTLAAAAGGAVRRADWILGFQLALRQLLINRLSMYTLIDRFRPLSFLPQVIRNWAKLDRISTMLLASQQTATRQPSGSAARRPTRSPIAAKVTKTANRYSGIRRRIPHT